MGILYTKDCYMFNEREVACSVHEKRQNIFLKILIYKVKNHSVYLVSNIILCLWNLIYAIQSDFKILWMLARK